METFENRVKNHHETGGMSCLQHFPKVEFLLHSIGIILVVHRRRLKLAECTTDIEIITQRAILGRHGHFYKIELSSDS